MDERLLDLYNIELRHLRETAAEFGRDFPKIAGRLSLDLEAKEACQDPYVERLLEGFAFLSARPFKTRCGIPALHPGPARDGLS
jgi:type VI secretion system protein ImpG